MADGERPTPIYSSLCDDPTLQDGIDAFVISLAERVDDLQDCEARGDLRGLVERTEALIREATRVGYEGLARCAATARAAALDRNGEAARKAVEELTEIAQRVRLGHRGSV